MVEKLSDLKKGYNSFTKTDDSKNMLMDIGVYLFSLDEQADFFDEDKETAFMILNGKASISFNSETKEMHRASLFDESPFCLHIPKAVKVTIHAQSETEVLIQKTDNPNNFNPVFYTNDMVTEAILGDNVWQNTARRVIRTVFDYNNAPYSNMVLGEVINLPGRWSSYPPHSHPQPEVYYYRFDRSEGFGVSIIGDDVYKIKNHSIAAIPGNLSHPQVSAPGYAMYYCWMIRHLDGDPWTYRTFDKEHEWLNHNPEVIWEPRI